jgi:transcription elongation factor Elf1
MRSSIHHIGHKHHLCSLVANGAISLVQLKKLTQNADFICRICGRSAVSEEYLRQPEPYDYVCGVCGKPFTTQTELIEQPCLSLG